MGVGGHDLAAGRRDPHGYAGSVGPIEAGDTVSITVEKIGTLTNPVVAKALELPTRPFLPCVRGLAWKGLDFRPSTRVSR